MYAKINNLNQVVKFPYTFSDLELDNPYTNYGKETDVVILFPTTEQATVHGHRLVQVEELQHPEYSIGTHKLEPLEPVYQSNKWVQGWQVVPKTPVEFDKDYKEQVEKVKLERNELLKNSDWTQLPDAPVDKQLWAAYRQALRDLPGLPGFPWTMQWPQQPE